MFRWTLGMGMAVPAALIAVTARAFPDDPPRAQLAEAVAPARPASVQTSPPIRDEQLLAERKLMMESLPRVRRAETLLKTARQQFDRGETAAALLTLQQLLNHPHDTFLWNTSDPRPQGARSQALALLTSMPHGTLQRYQEMFGAEAGRLLAKARHDGNPLLLDEVARRFTLTAEGYEAAVLLAAWWLDHGAPARSAAHWDHLFAMPAHRDRIQPAQRMQAVMAYARCGRTADAERVAANLSPEPLAIARRGSSFEQWLHARAAAPDTNSIAVGGVVAGSPHRNGIAAGSAPVFHQPAWSAPLAADPNDDLRPMLTAWEQELADGDGPGSIAHFALGVGNLIVYRDVQGLRAVDVVSGQSVWHTPLVSSLSSLKFSNRSPASRGPNKYDLKFLDQTFGENSVSGMLASDGVRVYAVDQLDWKQVNRQANSLVAIECAARQLAGPTGDSSASANETKSPSTGGQAASGTQLDPPSSILHPRPLRWRIGGPVVDDQPRQVPLAGHFFLGPPLPADGLLFALTEHDQQVKLNCLMPHSGDVLWSQTVAVPSTTVSSDERRFFRAYPLACADGIVICPTPAGVLVAVDALTGSLLWAQPCDDIEPRQERQRGMQMVTSRPEIANPAVVSLPVIAGGRVLYLPPQSTRLQCLDLRTGDRLWQTFREEHDRSSEHLATATDDVVLMIGRRCRALRLDSGAETWSVRFDSWPSGRGVRIGSQFLVPLTRGALSQIDLTTGRQVAVVNLPPDQRPGNLVVHRDVVVSMGPAQVAAFPRAEPLRKRLLDEVASTGGGTATPDRVLRLVALDSLSGFHVDAYRRLSELRARPLADADRAQVETALRQVLLAATSPDQLAQWQRRNESGGDSTGEQVTRGQPRVVSRPTELPPERWFELLDQWSAQRPAADRLEAMMRLAAWEQSRGDWQAVADLSEKIADLDTSLTWSPPDDPARRVSAVRWLTDRVAREQSKLDDESLVSLLARWDAELDAATHSADTQPLRHLLAAASGWPQAETARTRLAAKWQELGQPQTAELLLIENRRRGAPGTAAEATRLLIELWTEEGLYDPASRLLRELDTRFADVPVDGTTTGRDYLAKFPRGLTWSAYRRLMPREWPTKNIAIREERWYDDRLHRTYNSSRMLALPNTSPFDLFDHGGTGGSELIVVDRLSGAHRFDKPIAIPTGYSHALSPQQIDCGHLLPLGAAGAMQAVSLLEGRLLWTTSPPGRFDRDQVVRVGPSGPNFCTFQSDSHLFVLNPTNGQVLWQRNDLEPTSGLVADTYTGLFGDADVLVVFAKDRAAFTLYRTATGEEIGRGRLDINPAVTRRVHGRRLLHFTEAEEGRRVRLWDPLSQQWLVDEPVVSLLNGQPKPMRVPRGQPASAAPCFTLTGDDLVFVTADGRLRIFDLRADEWRVDLELPPHLLTNVESVRIFRDRERYLVGLTPTSASQDQSPTQFFASDVMVPVTHLHGTLIAVSRPDAIGMGATGSLPASANVDSNGQYTGGQATRGTLLWEQRLQPCSVLQVADPPLPFLVVLCREKSVNQLTLRVELRHVTTGDVIVGADQLYPDRIVQFSADPDQHLIELIGSKSTVRMEFGKE